MNDKSRFHFRAWHKVNGLIKFGPDYCDCCEWWDFPDAVNSEEWIVEQSTGIKDKNGKLIYEGDIVRIVGDVMTIPLEWDGKLFEVTYQDGSFCFDLLDHSNGTLFDECWEYEVVGNIHQNKELLEAHK